MCTEKYYSKNFDINNVSNLVLIGSIKKPALELASKSVYQKKQKRKKITVL